MVVVFLDLDGVVLPIANSDDAIYKYASETTDGPVAKVGRLINPSVMSFLSELYANCDLLNVVLITHRDVHKDSLERTILRSVKLPPNLTATEFACDYLKSQFAGSRFKIDVVTRFSEAPSMAESYLAEAFELGRCLKSDEHVQSLQRKLYAQENQPHLAEWRQATTDNKNLMLKKYISKHEQFRECGPIYFFEDRQVLIDRANEMVEENDQDLSGVTFVPVWYPPYTPERQLDLPVVACCSQVRSLVFESAEYQALEQYANAQTTCEKLNSSGTHQERAKSLLLLFKSEGDNLVLFYLALDFNRRLFLGQVNENERRELFTLFFTKMGCNLQVKQLTSVPSAGTSSRSFFNTLQPKSSSPTSRHVSRFYGIISRLQEEIKQESNAVFFSQYQSLDQGQNNSMK